MNSKKSKKMSFQGSQIRLAFGLNGLNNRELSYEAITTVNYVELNRRLQEEEKLISFSEITWPFIFIQAEANKHIMIDDIGLFNFENQILNSPRTAQIGHVIRKSELNFIEKLNLILEIMRFEKTISLDEEKNPNLESEFLKREIKGLVEPKIIEGLSPIITKTTKFQMSQMESLESLFTFDDALQYAEEYIDVLSEIRGNRHQWKSLLQLIREPVEEHLLELKVEKKDILER